MDPYDFLNPANEMNDKECAECSEPHANKGSYCSLACANESMR
jgi:hypothetical protein